ncbi:cytochrome b/b6 domain-containing protein [Natranaerofaba carboxydovora]|uniref:cytochrome b/b6 domain-containing protein n=1 Tax=Natranaerofaba carboxydovora TaxID=2742683 RepID=UPI001F12E1A1|nr:cytochrome b/b6 domain-containing protein [Natranaerofaba carboxydovora]UMZ75325.1 Prokaryotic cytochrome b561 [Natranaerofaba carboxydovora]
MLVKLIKKMLARNKLPPSKKLPEDVLIKRNSRLARFVHWFHLISFFLLTITGLAYYYPIIATPVAGIASSMVIHRVIGVVFIIVPVVLIIIYFRRFILYMSDYSGWQIKDVKWFLKFPLFMLLPAKIKMPSFNGKINPGQKLLGSGMLIGSFLMAISGLFRMLTNHLSPNIITGSAFIHQLLFPLLILLLLGHVFIGSGIHPIYRGVSRGMLGDGKLRVGLVRIHWKDWLDKGPSSNLTSGWKVLITFLLISGLIYVGPLLLIEPEIDLTKENPIDREKINPGIYSNEENEASNQVSIEVEKDGEIYYIIHDDNIKSLTSWQAKDILINSILVEKNNKDNND